VTCADARALIPAWVDQELSQLDGLALERHLSVCPQCASEAKRHASFVKGLKGHLPRLQAPADLRARVLRGLDSAAFPPKQRLRPLAWLGGGVLAGAALVALLTLLLPQRGAQDAWTQFYRDDHQTHSQADTEVQYRSSSQPMVAAWLAKNLGHPVHVPEMPDAQLVGARLSVLRGQTVALDVYRSQGKTVSLFVGDPKVLCPLTLPQDQLFADSGSPYSLVAWQHKGHFHILVAELGLEQLKKLAHQCQVSAI
jgi:anti-sigma factor RsiW